MQGNGYRDVTVDNLSLSYAKEKDHTISAKEALEYGKGIFREKHTHSQLLDYIHATEYLFTVSYPGKTDKSKRGVWLNEC